MLLYKLVLYASVFVMLVFRCHLDGFQQTSIVEWNNKKRNYRLINWIRLDQSTNAGLADSPLNMVQRLMIFQNPNHPEEAIVLVKIRPLPYLSTKKKLQIDYAQPYLYGRTSQNSYLEVDRLVERESFYEDDTQALINLEEQPLALGICTDHVYSEYVKDGNVHSIEKEFEDVFTTYGANPKMYILSSGKWNVNQGYAFL